MRQRLPSLGSFLSLCTLLLLISCDQRTPEQLTGVSAQPPEEALADISGAPRVEINTPEDGATLSPGVVRIEGRTRERGNDLLRTDLWIIPEICCLSYIAFTTTREGNWSFDWDTRELYGGRYGIMAVAHDTEGWSTSASVSITLDAPGRPERPRIVSLVLERDSLVAGESMGGTVTLEFPAIDDSSSVTVRTLPFHPRNVELVPQVIRIPQGDSVGHFTVTALPVAHPDHVPINGVTGIHEGDFGQTDFVWILPAGVTIDSLTLNPTTVPSGGTSEATVRLTGPAPDGGAVVELESSDINVATVQPTVTVPAGQTTATVMVTAGIVEVATGVFVRGTYGGVQRSDRLIVDRAPSPPGDGTISSLTINPEQVIGGESATGTVRLNAIAEVNTPVTLSSSNTSVATVPSSVTVPAGAVAANFPITTLPNQTGQSQISVISGQTGDVTRSSTITTHDGSGPDDPGLPRITSVRIHPDTVTAGQTRTGQVQLSAPAPGGMVIHLTSSAPHVASVPDSIITSPGATAMNFTITAHPAAAADSATIIAAANGTSRSAIVRVLPGGSALASLTLSPQIVQGGDSSQGTATLTAPAPAGGAVVALSSSDAQRATVSASVTVPAGQTSATFTVTTHQVATSGIVTISGTWLGVTRVANLQVNEPEGTGQLASLSINPDVIVGGQDAQGSVTLAAAVSGPTQVTLTSVNTSVATVPSSVTVPAGQTSATFVVTTLPNTTGQGQFSEISAHAGGVTRSATITTTGEPSGPAVASVEIVPSTLGGGGPATGFVTFSSPPTDGAQVSLTSSHPDIVQVPSSATWTWSSGVRAFPVTTSPVASNTQVTITATACCGAGGQATGMVTVTTGAPPPSDAVRITRARFRNGILEVRATSSSQTALLTVFIQGSQTGNDIAIMGLRHIGNGRYEGERPWINAPAPDELEVRSNLGGSDRDRVR